MHNRFFKPLAAAALLLAASPVSRAGEWTQFTPGGEYAVKAPDGRYLVNPMLAGGVDFDFVGFAADYDTPKGDWVLNDEGGSAISVRSLSTGDYINKDAKIRLASTVDFVNWKNNQTFTFYKDADVAESAAELQVKIMCNSENNRFWRISPDGTHLGTVVTTLADAAVFTLVSLNADVPEPEPTVTGVSAMTAQERAECTELALTGDVTERDFALMRTEMVRLKTLSLSGTTLTSLPARALSGMTSLQNLTLPEGLETIGAGAFLGCANLHLLDFPESLKSIGALAFARCGIRALEFPAGLVELGTDALAQTPNLRSIKVAEGNAAFMAADSVLYTADGATLLKVAERIKGGLTIPATVKHIAPYAAMNCSRLTGALVLPEGLLTVGAHAFENCPGFTGELALPATVTSIGRSAFFGCTGLEGKLTLPAAVSTVAPGAFGYISEVETVELPASTTVIRQSAFECCTGVTTLKSDAAVPPTVGAYALRGIGRELTYVAVPAGSEAAYQEADVWSEFANYSAPVAGPERFEQSGRYLIQYVGENADPEEPMFLTYTDAQGNGSRAILGFREEATTWTLDFTESEHVTGLATDVFYTLDGTVYHINHQGNCYVDPEAGYVRNANRTFRFFADAEGRIGILGNGVVWTSDGERLVSTAFTGKAPEAAHFVWALVDPTASSVISLTDGSEAAPRYYTLSGLRVDAPSAPGIYIEIVNGITRKILKK